MKKHMKYDTIITYIFYILLATTLVWDIFARGSGKVFRIGLIYITIFIARLLFNKTFLKKSKAGYVLALIFIFFSMYLANVMDFYSIPNYDKLLHLVSGVLLAFLGLIIYIFLCGNKENLTMRPIAMVVFPLLFAIACAGAWEIWEFTTDQIFGFTAQNNSLHDTMWDIICGTVGGSFSCFFMYLYIKGKNIRIVKMIIKDMED
ncbi:hypothetical protein [Clostridium aciditolerans]|uniref:Membrane-spanning protein n=1 Tax=Clostridium aciditolerans TaxID=339861 RepID=A0A934HP46_9CLOT|nr:hypothetical protein [Clostridium aciditolerans]MBI6871836.1 hypothetical protein [Clostridium aciditolerans]